MVTVEITASSATLRRLGRTDLQPSLVRHCTEWEAELICDVLRIARRMEQKSQGAAPENKNLGAAPLNKSR